MSRVESHLHPEGSYDVADHVVPTGREEIWRFTPLKRLRGLHGEAVFGASIAARMLQHFARAATAAPFPQLTEREHDVLRLVATGMTNAEVADQLFLSPRTIHAHLHRIFGKIGVSSRSAATRFAVEHGLV